MVTQKRKHSEAVFRAIADPTRRSILGLLRGRKRTVGEIAGHFRMSRPAVSKHLRLLRAVGLVVTESEGAARICQLDPEPLRAVGHWLVDYEALWNENLRSLKRYVEDNR